MLSCCVDLHHVHTSIFVEVSDIWEHIQHSVTPRAIIFSPCFIPHLPPHQSRISATAPRRSRMGALLPAVSPPPHIATGGRARAYTMPRMHARGAAAPRGVRAHAGQVP